MNLFFIIYCITLISALLSALGYTYCYLAPEQWAILGSEEGIFEKLSALTFGLTALLSLIIFFKKPARIWLYFGFLMLSAYMREMDLHKAWTTDSIFKLRFYSGDAAPFYEKVLGLLFVLILVLCLIQFIRHIPSWISNVVKFQPIALSIFMGLGTLAFGKLLDSMARLLPFLADFHGQNRPLLALFEESFEMTASFFFLLVCLLALFFKAAENQDKSA